MDTNTVAPAPAPSADANTAPEPKAEETKVETSAAPAGETKAEAEERRRHKVKIDGEELEVDEDELKAGYQSRKASQKAWQAAAEKEKQILAFFKKIKDNPRQGVHELLAHPAIGHDLKKVATDLLLEEIEREKMSPEARELADVKRELEAHRREKEEAERLALDEQTAAIKREYSQRIEKEIVDAIKPSGLPITKFTFKRVAFYLKEGIARGYKLTAADVVPLVRKDYEDEHRSFFEGYDDEALEKVLGEQVSERLSKRRIAKLKGQVTGADAPQGDSAPAADQAPRKPRAEKKDGPKETFQQVAARIARGG